MKRFLDWLLTAAILIAVASSCGDPLDPDDNGGNNGKEETLSNDAKLSSISFVVGSNPALETNSISVIANGYYYLSVSDNMDLANLVPTFSTSKNATVTINGVPYEQSKGYDFSKLTTISVTSESGKTTKNYKVLVSHGNADVDTKIYEFMADFKVPGVSISIMRGSDIVYSRGYGFADVSKEVPTTADHLFRMASISKQFCTLCIMDLYEKGKLSLDDKVFGDKGILAGLFTNITTYHEGITVRHLLSHSSGICAGLDDPAFTSSYRYFGGSSSNPVPTDTLIQRTINARQYAYSTYTPGARYNYSNVGFCILHRIVEVVSGKDYESYLKEDVLKRMGITDTHIGGYENERRSNECVFYSQDGTNGYANPLRNLAGAAGIITSTNQMMKILAQIDGDDDVPDAFQKSTLELMYTPYAYTGEEYPRYGLGWRMNHSNGRFVNSHYHGGNIAGTATLWVGHATGDKTGSFKKPMSGAFICNSRAYNSNSTGDIDDNIYVLMSQMLAKFDK